MTRTAPPSRRLRRERVDYSHLLDADGRLDRDEQRRVLAVLLPEQNRQMVGRFALMLTLSVTIAVMGLAANSVAVVIGAMLIAPLMTPIMTFSAAVGLGLGRRAAQAAFLVVLGTAGSIALAMLLARLLQNPTIGSEILARTRPDARDLIVAVAAGAAGAYATARSDVSSTLPGVAVAVALVPPLATTGVLLEAGERTLAEGSALLYATNMLAIIVSAGLVFLFTGVTPTIRLCLQSTRIAFTTIAVVAATVAIAIPLTTRSIQAAETSHDRANTAAEVARWVGGLNLEITNVDIAGSAVTVELSGPDEPPPAYTLATQLVPLLGGDTEVVVRWDQRAQGVARADSPPAADPEPLVREVINNWIDDLLADGLRFDLLDLAVSDVRVDVELGGPIAPPPSPTLANEIADAVGAPVDVAVRWIQQIDQGLVDEAPAARLERFVQAWIGARSGVRLLGVTVDGETLRIDLGVVGRPLGLAVLHDLAIDSISGATRVEIRTLPFTVVSPTPDFVPSPDLD